MLQNHAKVEVSVEEVKEAVAGLVPERPSVVIDTEARIDGTLRDASIEVRDEDAPAMAVALLNADLPAERSDQDLPAAVQCLAAGVVHAAQSGHVRLHLQFESGQVLPIEMSREAAAALGRGLLDHTRGD